MYYIDPHIHMVSRITDDYVRMARAGCVAASEPAIGAERDCRCGRPFGIEGFAR